MDRRTAAVVIFGIVCFSAGLLSGGNPQPISGSAQSEWWLFIAACVVFIGWQVLETRKSRLKLALETVGGVAAIGLLVVNVLLWQAQTNSLKVDQRAWVGLDKPMVADKINFPGPRFTWSGPDGVIHPIQNPNPLIRTGVSMRNFGKTPAFDVVVNVFSSDQEMLDAESNAQCKFSEDFSTGKAMRDNKQPSDKWPTLGITIFPGETFFKAENVPGGDVPRLFIVGCIAYRDTFDRRHRTRFCYRSPVLVTDPEMKDGDAFVQCNIYNDAN